LLIVDALQFSHYGAQVCMCVGYRPTCGQGDERAGVGSRAGPCVSESNAACQCKVPVLQPSEAVLALFAAKVDIARSPLESFC